LFISYICRFVVLFYTVPKRPTRANNVQTFSHMSLGVV